MSRRWLRARSQSTATSPARPSCSINMLEISEVTKEYATPRGPLAVLSGVSLSMQRGEAAAIMGPSGVGKSTLLYIVGGLELPTSGHVTLDGSDPHRLGEKQLAEFRNRKV